jgi:hypothetical protein
MMGTLTKKKKEPLEDESQQRSHYSVVGVMMGFGGLIPVMAVDGSLQAPSKSFEHCG